MSQWGGSPLLTYNEGSWRHSHCRPNHLSAWIICFVRTTLCLSAIFWRYHLNCNFLFVIRSFRYSQSWTQMSSRESFVGDWVGEKDVMLDQDSKRLSMRASSF